MIFGSIQARWEYSWLHIRECTRTQSVSKRRAFIWLHIREYVPSRKQSYKTTCTRYYDLRTHILLRIRSPDHGRCHRREYIAEPYKKSNMHPWHTREHLDKKRKSHDHNKCCDEFWYHKFPHTFCSFLHFFRIEAILAMMDTHPEFSEQRTMPYCSESKRSNRHYKNHDPRESNLHKKKIIK